MLLASATLVTGDLAHVTAMASNECGHERSHFTYTVRRLSSMRLIDGSVRGTPNVTKVTVAGGGQSV